jgi:hypothetical protein
MDSYVEPRCQPQRSPRRVRTSASLHEQGATFSGLRLSRGMTFDAWVGVGRQLARMSRASAWWLGDWLIFGERAYGERYKTALELTDLDYQTLRNYAWVARSFPMSRRRDSLSFQHHAEVASLAEPEQDLWLMRAERQEWTRNELRRQLLSCRPRAHASQHASVIVRMQIGADREARWREAASAANQDLVEWLASVADHAALGLDAPAADQNGSVEEGPRISISS